MLFDGDPPLGLLENDPETGILGDFPITVRRPVIAAIVHHISSTANRQQYLKTRSHIYWVMEVIGQGLALPIEDHDLIKNCIEIYSQWLQAYRQPNESIPPDLINDPEPFFKNIYMHFTLVFDPSKQTAGGGPEKAENQKLQVMLCTRVLEILQVHGKECGAHLTHQMWEVLLKSVLGVTHKLLSPHPKSADMADQLCANLLRVLFELWLHACGRFFPSPTMWKTLQRLCATWLHRMPLVLQWNATCLALTKRVLNLLYGPTEGTPGILMYPPGRSASTSGSSKSRAQSTVGAVKINMPDACAVQCWHRMLHIIGNPTKIQHAKIFLHAMEGVANMVDCFLDVGQGTPKAVRCDLEQLQMELQTGERKARPPMPRRASGNSILHVFGHWLFDATYSSFEEGRAQALGALCRIFCSQPSGERFLAQYLARFYTAITDGLSKDGLALTQIIMNSTTLFSRELVGSRVLVMPFIPALEKVLSRDQAPVGFTTEPYSNLRKASVEVLISLFSLPNHFGHLEALTCYRGELLEKRDQTPQSQKDLAAFVPEQDPADVDLPPDSQESITTHGQSAPLGVPNSDPGMHSDTPSGLSDQGQADPQILVTGDSGGGEGTSTLGDSVSQRSMAGGGETKVEREVRAADAHLMEKRSASIPADSTPGAAPNLDGASAKSLQPKGSTTPNSMRKSKSQSFSSSPSRARDSTVQPSPSPRPNVSQTSMPATGAPQRMSGSEPATIGGKVEQRRNFWDIKNRLAHLLIKAFECETDPLNTQMLLYAIAVYVCEDVDHTPNLPQRALRSIQRQLIRLAWPTDVTQTAFEVLAGLVHLREIVRPQDLVMCLCEYINKQAGLPAIKQTSDLHSKIAGAYRCLQTWVTTEQWIVKDRETLSKVLEVIELGITGSRSREAEYVREYKESGGKPKEEKMNDPKPPSQRVKDAAELLLINLLGQVGNFPPPCGPASISSIINEDSIIREFEAHGIEDARSYMRYFGVDDELVMCLCDKPFEEGGPGVTVVVRDMMGLYTFHAKLTYTPKGYQPCTQTQDELRPKPLTSTAMVGRTEHPINDGGEPLKLVPSYTANQIPAIDQLLDAAAAARFAVFQDVLQSQIEVEQSKHEALLQAASLVPFPDASVALDVPEYRDKYLGASKFQMGRQLGSHLGLFSLTNLRMRKDKRDRSRRVVELGQDGRLLDQLRLLDELPERETDVFTVLYVPKGCSSPEEIVRYKAPQLADTDFETFLDSLGWAVDVKTHRGWCKPLPRPEQCPSVPYYADLTFEVVYFVPSLVKDGVPRPTSSPTTSRPLSMSGAQSISEGSSRPESMSDDLAGPPGGDSIRTAGAVRPVSMVGPAQTAMESDDSKGAEEAGVVVTSEASLVLADILEKVTTLTNQLVMIVWLEDFDDQETFPFKDEKKTVLYVHPLKSGLYRIRVESKSVEGPLMDGMVVSRKVLGKMVRQTALNAVRRRRANMDNKPEVPTRPHNIRKKHIEETINSLRIDQPMAEFYANLLASRPQVLVGKKSAFERRMNSHVSKLSTVSNYSRKRSKELGEPGPGTMTATPATM